MHVGTYTPTQYLELAASHYDDAVIINLLAKETEKCTDHDLVDDPVVAAIEEDPELAEHFHEWPLTEWTDDFQSELSSKLNMKSNLALYNCINFAPTRFQFDAIILC